MLTETIRVSTNILNEVCEGTNLDRALDPYRKSSNAPLIFELCYGTLRHWYSLKEHIDMLLVKSLKKQNNDIHCLLLIGAYQLHNTKIPAYAVVSESVIAARNLGKEWATGLVNAVLKKAIRQIKPKSAEAQYETPDWLLRAWKSHYPEEWVQIAEASNRKAPMTLRANISKISRNELITQLKLAGILAKPGSSPTSIVLSKAQPSTSIPGFKSGLFSVQDEASQWAAELLAPSIEAQTLDACAAPGIKSAQILERNPNQKLTSIDIAAYDRSYASHEGRRLGINSQILPGDATKLDWWNGESYDSILLDAPCSGTGTIRRNPDIKLHQNEENIGRIVELQLSLLTNLWKTLSRNGSLLYCTCSLLQEENDLVMETFLATNKEAQINALDTNEDFSLVSRKLKYGYQILPNDNGPDGFYFASLSKRK